MSKAFAFRLVFLLRSYSLLLRLCGLLTGFHELLGLSGHLLLLTRQIAL